MVIVAVLAAVFFLQLFIVGAKDTSHVAGVAGGACTVAVNDSWAAADSDFVYTDLSDMDAGAFCDIGCGCHGHSSHFGLTSAGFDFSLSRGRIHSPAPLFGARSRLPLDIYRPPIV
ncbi:MULTISPECIES: hypothetical protein [unclassified Pseudomonas]|uniref:hypothetical protein n=1 Tax=unclassified Pseudomonas TaxID=196821 RepID=UPI0024481EE3|nr:MULTISPECIES: hypothetical protein [unclassified Pseudomonas]MDG9924962.1 hypothetical protein [Pseudomonas sp. GD04045]MDH0036243.1 hypothetical protein [Pseudomonas sp. GD04019]